MGHALIEWAIFFLNVIITFIFLYIPSFPLLKCFSFGNIASFAISPILSISFYGTLSMIYGVFGVFTDFVILYFSFFLVSLIITIVLCRRKALDLTALKNTDGYKWIFLYSIVGILLTIYVFLIPMGDSAGMGQTYDDLFHYALMRNFLATGDYSILHCSMYTDINSLSSYYPAGLHLVVASIASVTKSSVLIVNNAVIFVIVSIIWTSGWLFFISTIFPRNKVYIYIGSFIILASVSCPWIFLTYGRITPNLLSFSLLPATISIFVKTFGTGITKRERVLSFCIVLLCAYSAIFTQPNFVFSCIIILYSFCIESIIRSKYSLRFKGKHIFPSKSLVVLFSLLVLIVWLRSYLAPFMRDVVHFNWPSTTPLFRSILNALTLCQGRDIALQNIIIGFLIVLGIVSICKSKKNIWLVATYFILFFVYVWSATFEGYLKHFISGFWYTDQYRIIALLTISAIPILICGVVMMIDLVKSIFCKNLTNKSIIFSAGCVSIIAVLLFMPNVYLGNNLEVVSGFGFVRSRNHDWLSADKPDTDTLLNKKKMDFLDKVKEITKNDIVENDPYDGSILAYQYNGIKTVYRHLYTGLFTGNTINSGKPILEDGSYLAENLNKLGNDENVKAIAKNDNVKYVLKLASDTDEYPIIKWMHIYNDDDRKRFFNGVISLDDNTSGFKKVLEDGNMRLYKIEY